MITFKSPGDLAQLDPHDPAYPVVSELVDLLIEQFPVQPYNAEDYGYVVLVEPKDTERALTELDMPWRLEEVPWEGASLRGGFIYAVYLGTEDYGLGFVIPDAPWVNGALRKVLEDILD